MRARRGKRLIRFREHGARVPGNGGQAMSSADATAMTVGISEVGRTDFRTSRSGESATASLQRTLALPFRYQPARLAIARSLGLDTQPVSVGNADGKTIRGETLFGQTRDEIAIWASLIIEHAGRGPLSRRALQDLVAAHWARGAGLLWDRLRSSDDAIMDLATILTKTKER